MAMIPTRRRRLLSRASALAGLVLSLSCSSGTAQHVAADPAPPPETSPPDGRPVISIIAPSDAQLDDMLKSLRVELSSDYRVTISPLRVEDSSPELVARIVARDRPRAVVLVNNSTVLLYRNWARTAPAPPVALILMASFAEELQRTVPNSVAISYEVPAVTAMVGLRTLGLDVRRVGVVYRQGFASHIARQEDLMQVEKLTFVRQELSNKPHVQDLRAALVSLHRAGVDAIWLPNDNGLLSPKLLTNVWLPYVSRLDAPVVVAVRSLVNEHAEFGTFAAIPDTQALAVQAADLLYELAEADWKLRASDVRLPISVKRLVDVRLARRFGLDSNQFGQVDFLIGR
ncbi:hypothetical protein BE08_38120 [Sorangium cellulosum]|uniref:ABC transporter substrate-binding protein n=1 Tax=Sorangium cellulosum TaxID=56 RepID=A0A150PSU8_SORCE|nr:hypothetical protein BE08_38120 [Sorangium cellulosum]